MSLDVESADVRTLTDLGFVALSAGLVDHAAAIFGGVEAIRPEGEAGVIGLALVHLARGDAARAVERLRRAEPSDAVLTFLGLAYHRLGARDEARDALTAVIASPDPSAHAALARHFLAELDGR